MLKVADLLMSKTLKSGTPPLRACVTALCLLLEVSPDAAKGASDKVPRKSFSRKQYHI